jgi:hypothetical protein
MINYLPPDLKRYLGSESPEIISRLSILSREIATTTDIIYLKKLCDRPITPNEVRLDLDSRPRRFGYLGINSYVGFTYSDRDLNYLDSRILIPEDLLGVEAQAYRPSVYDRILRYSNVNYNFELTLDLLSVTRILQRRLGCLRRSPTYLEDRINLILRTIDRFNPVRILLYRTITTRVLFPDRIQPLTLDEIRDEVLRR